MILTSNTEATENKVQFFYLAYRVKGFQCHSNNSLQLLGMKTTTTKQYMLFKLFSSFRVRSQNDSYKNSIVFRLARHLCSSTSLVYVCMYTYVKIFRPRF